MSQCLLADGLGSLLIAQIDDRRMRLRKAQLTHGQQIETSACAQRLRRDNTREPPLEFLPLDRAILIIIHHCHRKLHCNAELRHAERAKQFLEFISIDFAIAITICPVEHASVVCNSDTFRVSETDSTQIEKVSLFYKQWL